MQGANACYLDCSSIGAAACVANVKSGEEHHEIAVTRLFRTST
jgi:hypothetical protein